MTTPRRGGLRCNHRDCRHKAPDGTCRFFEDGGNLILGATGLCEMREPVTDAYHPPGICQAPGCLHEEYAKCAQCSQRLCVQHVNFFPQISPTSDRIESDAAANGSTPLCSVCLYRYAAIAGLGMTPFPNEEQPSDEPEFEWPTR